MRVAGLFLLLVTTLSCHAADTGPEPAHISVSGTGTVTAVPDQATVSVGVTSHGDDAASAVAANNEAMVELNKALDKFDIDERDRRSRGFNVQPRYDHRRTATTGSPEVIGYTVSNQLTVRVRDLELLGDLLGAVVDSGGNTINSLQFSNAGLDALLDDARKLAVENARHKAQLYAEAAGGSVGRVVSIYETGAAVPRPQYRGEMANLSMSGAARASVPISTGENEFKAVINVVFEFEQ